MFVFLGILERFVFCFKGLMDISEKVPQDIAEDFTEIFRLFAKSGENIIQLDDVATIFKSISATPISDFEQFKQTHSEEQITLTQFLTFMTSKLTYEGLPASHSLEPAPLPLPTDLNPSHTP
jgi:hypothetical protein